MNAKTHNPVEAIRHRDRRTNIPTEELRDFVAEEEAAPRVLLYPRQPDLDPQLVWQGKDEQDRADLAVPAAPIYIQEKIHPQALIADLAAQTADGGIAEEAAAYQTALFADFNGAPADFAQKVDFYHHEQNWANRFILGDSLLVMASLAEKEGLRGQVQMIYIDPPYGIKFGSNWQVSTRRRNVKDGKAADATRQPEQIRAFRDTWQLGIHSYLAYLRDRLTAARDLLTESGSIFVQIGDENVHLVRCLLDEVFGADNYISHISFRKTSGFETNYLPITCDFILWYSKNRSLCKYRQLYKEKQAGESGAVWYDHAITADGKIRRLAADERPNPEEQYASITALFSEGFHAERSSDFPFDGEMFTPGPNRQWKTDIQGLHRLVRAGRITKHGKTLKYIRSIADYPIFELSNVWEDTWAAGNTGDKVYVVQTDTKVVARCLLMATDPGDLVLDPTCGSGTTAYVAEQWGRRWITCDTSRVALALARTRLMAARYPYYLLADSPEGVQKEQELSGQFAAAAAPTGDIRQGFVYKRVPHVTLKSIANNPDIQEGLSRAEIDAAIARHAATETLYDQPYEDRKRVRVCGPFSVESLSPHRILPTDVVDEGARAARQEQDFVSMILDNLAKAGVQNTRKDERLVFDRVEPHAGEWVHAVGEYTDAGGAARRGALSIGPEHGTVSPQQVKEAAKEAVQGVGFEVLIVCGFAFDPHVSEEVKRYGKLTVLPARMNPDLAMGADLLKKTGAGNLFMVFGEPDVEISRAADGQVVVEIKGVDVYDPTTGQIRNSSTADIACWFIDTNYDGESFFVRHAYFTGADEPYAKLQRALRAEIDAAAWHSLYRTVSRPFAPPAAGKIAVKVINHYGDEVLKVFAV